METHSSDDLIGITKISVSHKPSIKKTQKSTIIELPDTFL